MSFGFDTGSSNSGFGDDSSFQSSASNAAGDNEMKTALQQLQTQAEFQSQVSQLTSRCWDLCYTGSPGAKFDDKRANCLKNCAERYIDVSVFLRKRFQEYANRISQQQQI
ncbi:unnamed protein product [Hymenolepis diminuta]|uniref:Mitochondrial import inner membrane translocase subunit n=1 Tax=Hymenolepis diminuta TaxID=6216 RepID=A0A0R3SC87_HYMDI|nr:unnamed protein product [Hymenolepis diminuta]VUZ40448.1 unnamed protein product [Hymenolepis diminuta]